MSLRAALLVGLLVLGLGACGRPVPLDKAAYVGDWWAPNMYLAITRDGSVAYERRQGTRTTSVSGPLQGFRGNDFDVGIWFLSTTFAVSRPPFQDGEHWKMVV